MDKAAIARALRKHQLTDFQVKVLLATYSIPKGKVLTYKELAKLAGRPKAYRAVGTALRKNPLAPTIPCHRVVRSDGTLGNYSNGGTAMKRKLLKRENALAGAWH